VEDLSAQLGNQTLLLLVQEIYQKTVLDDLVLLAAQQKFQQILV